MKGLTVSLNDDLQEVSDVVQRVSGESQPVPLWRTASAESLDPDKGKKMAILYSFELKLKVGNQILLYFKGQEFFLALYSSWSISGQQLTVETTK